MASGTVYLDVDDEITSAAQRIRGSEATKLALVVPYGSRISTSRMNFRLLSREALVNNRRLSIVAADAATRALAASAGLPVFASVAEYEAAGTAGAVAGEVVDVADVAPDGGATPPTEVAAAGLEASATVVTPPAATAIPSSAEPPIPPDLEAAAVVPAPRKRGKKAAEPVSDETQAIELPFAPPAAAAATGAAAVSAASASAGSAPLETAPTRAVHVSPSTSARGIPIIRSRTLPRVGAPAVIAAAGIVLALVVVAVGAYLFLPSAEITVTPRSEEIGPISLVVRADPDATAVDVEAAIVPATRVEVPVEVSETFTTTGRRIEEAAATGEVTFSNLDFTSANTVPAGSVVSTQSGVRFKTDRAVTIGKAKLVGLQIVPTEGDVGVTAVKAGTAGNVEPNTILTIPADEDPLTLKVRNRAATTGGTHEEFPQIAQADIDAALEALGPKLTEAFAAAVDGGAGAPEGATPFPETAVLGESTPTVDPTTLIGKEVETFEFGLGATGTVIAVDDSPVEDIAETRLLANVGSDHRLVEGSIHIVPGDPTVANGEVSFPVTARAERVQLLDPADLLARIKGQTVEQAKTILSAFGEVEITTWPDWVTTIPGIESRVTLAIAGQGGAPEAGESAAPSASGVAEPSESVP